MAIANATTTTTVDSQILTEHIERAQRFAVQEPTGLHRAICYIPPTLMNTKRFTDNITANLVAASTVGETDTVVVQAAARTPTNIDTALYATGVFLGDWAQQLSVIDEIPGSVEALFQAMDLRFELDMMATVPSMTNTLGGSTQPFDVSYFVQCAAKWRTVSKTSPFMPYMVLSEQAKQDLHASSMANSGGIYSTPIGAQLVAATGNLSQGEWQAWGNFMIASSDLVPVVGGANRNFISQGAARGSHGMALPFSLDMGVEAARKAENLGLYLIASEAHAIGIADQARNVGCDSRQTAA